jgi:hypothetical protein
MRTYTNSERARVLELVQKGRSYGAVERITKIPKSTIWNICDNAGVRSTCQNPWIMRHQADRAELIATISRETGYPAPGIRSILSHIEAAGYRIVRNRRPGSEGSRPALPPDSPLARLPAQT